MSKIIMSFGCPRSGTTFLWKATLALAGDALVVRIPETRLAHPTRSRDRLLELVRTFPTHQVLLIRTVRHPLDICESFLAARRPDYPTRGLGRKTNPQVCEMIREESESWAEQYPVLAESESYHCEILEVRYDAEAMAALWDPVSQFMGPGAIGLKAFRLSLSDFGKVPVRPGRLKMGLGRISSPEERGYFSRHLAEVIKREGYEGQEPGGDTRIA